VSRHAWSRPSLDPSAATQEGDMDGVHEHDVEELLIEEVSIDGMCGVY
jgi:mycofactocin precursor